MSKSLKDYLPDHNPVKRVNVQGRVPEALFNPVREIMDKKELTWNDVLTACLQKFLDDLKESKK
jgi:hypothetical protein